MVAKREDNKQYLTQEGYDKLLQEQKDLRENQLPTTLDRLKEAISQWDISENAEYDTAMTEKDLIEWRIKEIEEMIHNVEIIKQGKKSDEVSYGSIVTFQDDKKRKFTFTVVGTWEVDVLEWTISLESPLWIALAWKKKWETTAVKAPSRRYNVKILEVK